MIVPAVARGERRCQRRYRQGCVAARRGDRIQNQILSRGLPREGSYAIDLGMVLICANDPPPRRVFVSRDLRVNVAYRRL
ncbi:hypothetical protein MESS2_690017 [Mesorhizobium metallidurans STM 2683]|uniref:Uncharacterized protein n=1 Tax=Mesorhizobium metallidurans STM 2683 TaxID=1297569 RepID=M5EVI0_9HYPH|nr:hypothetical protein MESS2_690017 [Mesorhizobium metallidurans STM 2683]